MAGRSRLGRMVLWWKSRKGMKERPFCPRGWLRLYKSGSMRSFPDTETNRERGEGIRIPNWLPGQSSKLAQILGTLERAGILK